jgi:hypothetical protein
MALPSAASKANCDSSTDDPKLAILTDLAGVIDKFNLLLAEVQPISARLTTLSGISATQAIDLAAVSTFMGTTLASDSQPFALVNFGVPLNSVQAVSASGSIPSNARGKVYDCTGSLTLSITSTAVTLGDGWSFAVRNSGTGAVAINPNGAELIDGAATITLAAGESCFVVCTGLAWKTVGRVITPTTLPTGYVSADTAITLGGLTTLTHGLGAAPKLIQMFLVCTTIDAGYAVGDIVSVTWESNTGSRGPAAIIENGNTTEIYIRMAGNAAFIGHKTTGVAAAITPTSWALRVRAWA